MHRRCSTSAATICKAQFSFGQPLQSPWSFVDSFLVLSLFLFTFQLDLLLQFDGDKSKIYACKIHEGSPEQFSTEITDLRLQILETILPTRLSDEVFRGILRFENATLPDTPIKEIEKALVKWIKQILLLKITFFEITFENNILCISQEYLYDDVPKTSCPRDCDYLNWKLNIEENIRWNDGSDTIGCLPKTPYFCHSIRKKIRINKNRISFQKSRCSFFSMQFYWCNPARSRYFIILAVG